MHPLLAHFAEDPFDPLCLRLLAYICLAIFWRLLFPTRCYLLFFILIHCTLSFSFVSVVFVACPCGSTASGFVFVNVIAIGVFGRRTLVTVFAIVLVLGVDIAVFVCTSFCVAAASITKVVVVVVVIVDSVVVIDDCVADAIVAAVSVDVCSAVIDVVDIASVVFTGVCVAVGVIIAVVTVVAFIDIGICVDCVAYVVVVVVVWCSGDGRVCVSIFIDVGVVAVVVDLGVSIAGVVCTYASKNYFSFSFKDAF